MTFFIMQSAHTGLTVLSRSVVDVQPFVLTSPASGSPWELATHRETMPLEAVECAIDSMPTRLREALWSYARTSFSEGRPLFDAVAELTSRIHHDFTFERGATTIETPLAQVYESRRGVCQDFARLGIACLRS